MIFIQNRSDGSNQQFQVLKNKLQVRVNTGKVHTYARHFYETEIKYTSELFYKLREKFSKKLPKHFSKLGSCFG